MVIQIKSNAINIDMLR